MVAVVAALLFLATAVNYLDRLALPIVSPLIRRDFGMDEEDYSHVLTWFLLGYAVMYAGSGYLVDRLGTKRGFAVFIAWWSSASMLHGLATGKWSLATYRFLLGLGEPGNWPAAAKAVNEWFPARFRAFGIGFFNAGSSLGSAIAPPAVAFLTLRFGWRAAFLFTGGAGFVWLIAWLILYDSPSKSRWLSLGEYQRLSAQIPSPPPQKSRPDFGRLLRAKPCLALIAARFFTDPVIYFVNFWLPEYLQKERGFNTSMIGRYAWVPYCFGACGYIAGGWLAAKLMGAGTTLSRTRKGVMLVGAAMVPAAMLAPFVPKAEFAIAAVCLITLGHGVWTSNLQSLPGDLFKQNEVGTVTGLSGCGGAIGGILANLATGSIARRIGYSPLFIAAGLMHPISIVLIGWLLPDWRFRQADARTS